MTIEIKNQAASIRAKIDPQKGGTVTSLVIEGNEKLWMPSTTMATTGWPGGGIPICFPIAGRVWHQGELGYYQHSPLTPTDRRGPLTIHGFAYDRAWQVKEARTSSLTLTLEADENSLKIFPWRFHLEYLLEIVPTGLRSTLKIHRLTDSNPYEMPVSAGFHPYFALSDSMQSKAKIHTSAKTLVAVTNVGGAGSARPLAPADLSSTSTAHNAILADLKSIHSVATFALEPYFRINILTPETLRHFVLWSKPHEGFYCAEPWMALPDAINNAGSAAWLSKGQFIELAWEITSF